jgi:hypothetical protein
MRSYYEHLETAMGSAGSVIEPKPTLRSSAIFPMMHFPGITSRVLFMGYWILKRSITEIAVVSTLRSDKGCILRRHHFTVTQAKTYRIELADELVHAGLSTEQSFVGSLEIEFFSTINLVFPYPALVINYYGPQFSSVVHTAQRVYNDFEDMRRNSQTGVPESGFNIYADENKEPFIGLINGPEGVQNSVMELEFYNIEGRTLKHSLPLGELNPYETRILYPAQHCPLKDFLQGKVGAAKAKFHVNWIFPRLVVGNIQSNPQALSITHSYYDTQEAQSNSDYWRAAEPGWYQASLMVPAIISSSHFTNIYFYPIYSPASFAIDIEIYSQDGRLLGKKLRALVIHAPFAELRRIDISSICQELQLSQHETLGIRLIAQSIEDSRLPARIKLGLDLGCHPMMPCNICTNFQPFNPALEGKPKSFRWAPILADQGDAVVWIMNSSPSMNYEKQANVELTFFREDDDSALSRNFCLEPHGFAILSVQQDHQLQAFFNGKIGWFTAITSNPYTTTYYFSENASGLIGGDHGF